MNRSIAVQRELFPSGEEKGANKSSPYQQVLIGNVRQVGGGGGGDRCGQVGRERASTGYFNDPISSKSRSDETVCCRQERRGTGGAKGLIRRGKNTTKRSPRPFSFKVLKDNDECSELIGLIPKAIAAMNKGIVPTPVKEGVGGSYLILDDCGSAKLGIFKPYDEEPYGPNNPKGFSTPTPSPQKAQSLPLPSFFHLMEQPHLRQHNSSHNPNPRTPPDSVSPPPFDFDDDELHFQLELEDDPYPEEEEVTLIPQLKETIGWESPPEGMSQELFQSAEADDCQPNMKRGVLPGEGAIRERAAYLLDHHHFAGVPPTVLVRCRHNTFGARLGHTPTPKVCASVHDDNMKRRSSTSKKNLWEVMLSLASNCSVNTKVGSFQQWEPHDMESWDVGPAKFSVDEVHRIGQLDIRLMNTDRHGGNILVRKVTNPLGSPFKLIPIDHAFTLPSSLDEAWFDWIHWPQAKIPFSAEFKTYVDQFVDSSRDIAILEAKLNGAIRPECMLILQISTMLLKQGVAGGLTLFDIGSICSRMDPQKPCRLEEMCYSICVSLGILERTCNQAEGILELKKNLWTSELLAKPQLRALFLSRLSTKIKLVIQQVTGGAPSEEDISLPSSDHSSSTSTSACTSSSTDIFEVAYSLPY